MSDWNLPWDGGCRCGAVRLRLTAPPMLAVACHCTGCQTMTASAFSLTLTMPRKALEITSGEPAPGGLAAAGRPDAMGDHRFCPTCMTWLYTTVPGMDFFVNVRPSTLDDHSWFVPFAETFRSEGLPWAQTGAVHTFAGSPSFAEYTSLSMAYMAKGARPGRPA